MQNHQEENTKVTGQCGECGTEVYGQRAGAIYECTHCINVHIE